MRSRDCFSNCLPFNFSKSTASETILQYNKDAPHSRVTALTAVAEYENFLAFSKAMHASTATLTANSCLPASMQAPASSFNDNASLHFARNFKPAWFAA